MLLSARAARVLKELTTMDCACHVRGLKKFSFQRYARIRRYVFPTLRTQGSALDIVLEHSIPKSHQNDISR